MRSVIVLGYGAEPYLEAALAAIAADCEGGDEIVLVDNGIDLRSSREERWPAAVRVVGDGSNTGFAGGCVRGATAAAGDVLVFVNSDAVIRPGALDALTRASMQPGVGIACGCLRLADRPDLVNSVGNPLHFSGISWAGSCGEPAVDHQSRTRRGRGHRGIVGHPPRRGTLSAASTSSTSPTTRTRIISLRAWLQGWRVLYVPDAIADHSLRVRPVTSSRCTWWSATVSSPCSRTTPTGCCEPCFPPWSAWRRYCSSRRCCRAGPSKSCGRGGGWCATGDTPARATGSDPGGRDRDGLQTSPDLLRCPVEPPMMSLPPGMAVVNAGLDAYWHRVRRSLVSRAWMTRRRARGLRGRTGVGSSALRGGAVTVALGLGFFGVSTYVFTAVVLRALGPAAVRGLQPLLGSGLRPRPRGDAALRAGSESPHRHGRHTDGRVGQILSAGAIVACALVRGPRCWRSCPSCSTSGRTSAGTLWLVTICSFLALGFAYVSRGALSGRTSLRPLQRAADRRGRRSPAPRGRRA